MTRLSHNYILLQNDITLFNGILEEAICGTIYETTIKTFQRTHDGCGDYKALMAQHAGKDKWIVVLRDTTLYVNSSKWNGNTSFTLQNHVERCRAAYVDIETAAMHVPGNTLNKRTRVHIMLEYINDCMDAKICAWVAELTNGIIGTSDDFEKVVAHLMSDFPIKENTGTKRNNAHISGLGGDL